ncbi:uncharacterized protein LOC129585485 [Paramacrobiotus metropolitanus]|uniref:uncharacterized protein LOC129585485 n=1 Tax=Paramacrobiotus metropolitanus TaxID=2943436 RepID=UPI0024459956|nr:uncharacterized protein LOC129585485 [Paramacrobiotus metropolitanus]
MTSSTSKQILQSLETCLLDRDPVTYGVCPISAEDFGLFYGKGDTARQLYLHTATDAELELLARACVAATFGINQQDVFDETYRKAGKMDVDAFASKFNLERSGILTCIKDDLLDRTNYGRPIQCELYKLNVYGTGGFFKAHKDTPRGANMFGALVIVFPTKHTGGELKLRHGGKEWTFDSAKELADVTEPSIGYVAFFSDVEHEVAVVQSGYRVTLTYNLYFGETVSRPNTMINAAGNHEHTFKTGLEQLLADPAFLPKGGLIGFGLQHEYPVNAQTELRILMENLKGSDALVWRICQQLSLPIQPKFLTETKEEEEDDDDEEMREDPDPDAKENAVNEDGKGDSVKDGQSNREGQASCYKPNVYAVLTDHVVDLSTLCHVDSAAYEMSKKPGTLVLPHSSGKARQRWNAKKQEMVKYSVNIQWITASTTYNKVKTEYIAFGNEASLGYLYGTVCLVAKIGPPGKRIKPSDASGSGKTG